MLKASRLPHWGGNRNHGVVLNTMDTKREIGPNRSEYCAIWTGHQSNVRDAWKHEHTVEATR